MVTVIEPELLTWADFEAWVKDVPNQEDWEGRAGPSAGFYKTGDWYLEFISSARYREGERALAEHNMVSSFMFPLKAYFKDAQKVCWRIPAEMDDVELWIVTRYADDGPEYCGETDKRCYVEKGWRYIKARCRVFCPHKQMVPA